MCGIGIVLRRQLLFHLFPEPVFWIVLLADAIAPSLSEPVCTANALEGALFHGAAPAITHLPLNRRGWESCEKCGGSERLGVLFDHGDLRNLNASSADVLLDAVRAYGVVVVKGQNLSRAEQVEVTAKLGEVVVLPKSFEGNDPEASQPAIQRITNFWSNGTWKGPHHNFGSYWHQDGQFWTQPKQFILSILHAQSTPPSQGETGFADLRAAYATLSKPLRERTAGASIAASVYDIADFRKGSPEDLAKFPEARHPIIDVHPTDQGPLLYLGSPHMRVEGLESDAAGKSLLNMLMTHATSPAFTYFHRWDPGDVLLWDNVQTLHHAFPYNNDGSAKREFYRTQARLRSAVSHASD